MRWDTTTQLTEKEKAILLRATQKVVASVMEREDNPCKLALLLTYICRQDLAVYMTASTMAWKEIDEK